MKPLAPSPELAASIQRQIDQLRTEPIQYWLWRVCKELNAFPIHGNQVYLWAIRPDGVVLCIDHEAFNHPTDVENDPAAIYEALTEGASTFPELRELLPAGPADTEPTKAS